MSQPRIDPQTRVGPYLLDDTLRVLGFSNWSLTNTADTLIAEPLLTHILTCLHAAGLADLLPLNTEVYYRQTPLIVRSYLRPRLTPEKAETLLDKVCARTASINKDPDAPYYYRALYLFGSHMQGSAAPGDVDLGAEIDYRETGEEIEEPHYYPFNRATIHDASAPLTRGFTASVSVHHMIEVRKIGAAHRKIWDHKEGRIQGPLIPPTEPTTSVSGTVTNNPRIQAELDEACLRIQAVTHWPEMPVLELGRGRTMDYDQWLQALRQNSIRTLAHLHCLHAGPLRDSLQDHINNAEPAEVLTLKEARPGVLPFLRACAKFDPWSLRPNGRLLRRSGVARRAQGETC